jgi:hypothetical protein
LFYQDIVKKTKDTQLADSVKKNVINYIGTFLKNYPDFNDIVIDEMHFCECIDSFIDQEIISVQLATIATRLRFIRWYLRFLYSTDKHKRIPINVMVVMDENVNILQTQGSISTTNSNLLTIHNPERLVSISNRIIVSLDQFREREIDPFIESFFKGYVYTEKELQHFGTYKLRYFVELGMRFSNVACRVQCTINLVDDTYEKDDYVCKMLIRENHIVRLVNKDKIGKYANPTPIPLDPYLSGYLLFYYKYCRNTGPYVFQTIQGKKWKSCSRDLKQFLLEICGIECNEIDVRFIHGSRKINLACYAAMCGFNDEKIRNFSKLLRHNLTQNIEDIYMPWKRLKEEKMACLDLMAFKGFDHLKNHSQMTVLSLARPKSAVATCFRELLSKAFAKNNIPVIHRTHDRATQTDHPDLEEKSCTELEDDDYPLPPCEFCDKKTDVYGPCGLKRDKHFGKFYLQCKQCYDGLKKRRFFRLGVTPRHPSKSKKPRNLLDIQRYQNLSNIS